MKTARKHLHRVSQISWRIIRRLFRTTAAVARRSPTAKELETEKMLPLFIYSKSRFYNILQVEINLVLKLKGVFIIKHTALTKKSQYQELK